MTRQEIYAEYQRLRLIDVTQAGALFAALSPNEQTGDP
jgi:hypothetical protein